MQDIKNKAGEILGTYEVIEVTKPDTYVVAYTNKDGTELSKTFDVTKADCIKLQSQAFNTNMRNFVAGLAREKKDTKTAVLKEYIQSLGIDTSLPTDEIKKQLDEIRLKNA